MEGEPESANDFDEEDVDDEDEEDYEEEVSEDDFAEEEGYNSEGDLHDTLRIEGVVTGEEWLTLQFMLECE